MSADGFAVKREICLLLEWYIGQCIRCVANPPEHLHHSSGQDPPALGEWWSDGIEYLDILQTAENTFKLLGVTWIDTHSLAPFEIDLELSTTDEDFFAKTTFRLGARDDRGRPTLLPYARINPVSLVERRPRQNCDWAMAVELTPPESG